MTRPIATNPEADFKFARAVATTHIAAPGAGKKIVVYAARFGSSAPSITVTLNGSGFRCRLDIDAADAVFPFCPVGWWELDENAALTSSAACASRILYKVVPV